MIFVRLGTGGILVTMIRMDLDFFFFFFIFQGSLVKPENLQQWLSESRDEDTALKLFPESRGMTSLHYGFNLFNSQTLLVWLGSAIYTVLISPILPKSCLECAEGVFSFLRKKKKKKEETFRNLVFAVLFEEQKSLTKSTKSSSVPA